MELNNYRYANKYINDGIQQFRELRRLIGVSRKYFDNATSTSTFKKMFSTTMRTNVSDYIEQSIVNMVDSENMIEAATNKCMEYCAMLNNLNDELGAEMIFYYYFMQCSISDISNQYYIARKTCYRHLNNAICELDRILEPTTYNIRHEMRQD